jgi:hypothetical protein
VPEVSGIVGQSEEADVVAALGQAADLVERAELLALVGRVGDAVGEVEETHVRAKRRDRRQLAGVRGRHVPGCRRGVSGLH